MLSVIDAMNASRGFIRPMREGEELMKSGMVISIGKKGKENDVVHIQALVLRTSGLQTKDPALVEMWVDTSKDYGDKIVQDNEDEFRKHCNCPAGNSEKCKHIVAVMLCLASLDEDELDDLSCTDTEKQWGALKKSTLKEYEAKRLSELCHVKGQRDVYVNNMPEITKEMKDRWKEKLINSAPLGELSIFMSSLRLGQGLALSEEGDGPKLEHMLNLRRLLSYRSWRALGKVRKWTLLKVQTLEPALKEFYEKHVVTNLDESVAICADEQGTSEWHRARKVRLTASKARAQYTYFLNKKANWDARYKETYHGTFHGNRHTDRGLDDEVSCRDKYKEKNLCYVLESGLLVRPEVPWLSASLDGTVMDDHGNLIRNLEVKSFKEGTRLTAEELIEMEAVPTLDKNGNMKKNNQHYAQMQIGLLVSGLAECDYCLYSSVSDDYVYRRISFDENHVLDLCSRLVHVYFNEFLPRMMASHNNSNVNVDDDNGGDDD